MKKLHFFACLTCVLLLANGATAQKRAATKDLPFDSSTLNTFKFRNAGPATTSGRISDFAVNPLDFTEYYIAVASGGIWKTVNAGTTFTPVFDQQPSYSTACITMEPGNPSTVWVGTGENNHQRSVGYGDGVYRSRDSGKSWENMGLKHSGSISKIIVHPQNPDKIYVAAYGPLWSAGGERGVYMSEDGGKTWQPQLTIDEHTGIADLVMHPQNPNILFAAAHQRRRHVFTYIGGGPSSALYKSADGGKTWRKINSGLPSADLGRTGLAIPPSNPEKVYAIVEAADGKGGFFVSTDRGESWQKQSDFATIGLYYQEIFCDPKDEQVIYAMDTYAHISEDGGKTFKRLGEKHKHVDNHALWINPDNTRHLLMGCDGGIYESFDRGQNWNYKENLPITQFYKVTTDNAEPFYNIYGGTQDNFSLGGPSRTSKASGIANDDWFVTNGGDGFESQVDPTNPDIVYAQAQYGWLVRYDKKSGERVFIQPQPGKNEPAYRWNWDAPLLISPHKPERLYFAANKLFRSDDRGSSWTAISPDLSRQTDRNQLPVMGRVWGMDAVQKNESTSIYGNIVALDESDLTEGLLYVGTDDGLVHISKDSGENWQRFSGFPGVPDTTYVNMLLASQHDENTVYAAFNNHKRGDFKPYLLKSTNNGQTWQSIASNLPTRGSVYAIAEDHEQPGLLFCGTEFGLFFSNNDGRHWTQMKGGLPTIAIRDIAIQKRESDLVLATFGRGFYILDDYSPLRHLTEENLQKEAHIFAVKDGLMFVPSQPLGDPEKGFRGSSYFTAPNPPVGVAFTWHLKEPLKSLKTQRQEREKKLVEAGKAVPYPSAGEIRAESLAQDPYLIFTITDQQGKVVRRLKEKAARGIHRTWWDFRYPAARPVSLKQESSHSYPSGSSGHLALPGQYQVSISSYHNGELVQLAGPQTFTIKLLNNATFAPEDRAEVLAFLKKAATLQNRVQAAEKALSEMEERLQYLEAAVMQTPGAAAELLKDCHELKTGMAGLKLKLSGDRALARKQFEVPPAISDRVEMALGQIWSSTDGPTRAQRQNYDLASQAFTLAQTELGNFSEQLKILEKQLDEAGAPWTPGRIPGRP